MTALVIGLGNPGGEYAGTRHNVGWMCLEELARRGRFGKEKRDGPASVRDGTIEGRELALARPRTYMNLSGRAAIHLTRKLGVDPADLIVVHDDIDLPFGRLRLKSGGGAGGHNGVRSVADSLRTQDFIRVRVGIARPPGGVDPVDYVLDGFDPGERLRLHESVLPRAADAVLAILDDGLERAMTEYNRAPDG